MKKTLITLAALAASVASAATADWTATQDTAGDWTFTTTQTGLFNVNLGAAAITGNESFTMTIETTLNAHEGYWGTGLLGTSDVYTATNGADQFRFYLGSADTKLVFNGNGGETIITDGISYGGDAWPKTFAVEMRYDAATDTFSVASAAGSDITWTTQTWTNAAGSFNFATLTNTTTQTGFNQANVYGDTTQTTITITKAVPEPATATLSLLALAGLAARRRRK